VKIVISIWHRQTILEEGLILATAKSIKKALTKAILARDGKLRRKNERQIHNPKRIC
jgi:hypothetical protein